jgi:hypothetical protein
VRYGECSLPAPINQPDDKHEVLNCFRFDRQDDTYFIIDYGENMVTKVGVHHLDQLLFGILHWYKKHISEKWKAQGIEQPTYFSIM